MADRTLDYLDPEDLESISNLKLFARLVMEGFSTGLHESPHKGFSVEFKKHRPYVAGDDIRHLDWKIFGRTDRYYIREYEEETDLRATVLLDASGSMAYDGEGISKLEYGKRLAACLVYLLLQQQESVGLVTFDDRERSFIPVRSGIAHINPLIETIQATEPGGETSMGDVFHNLVPKIDRRSLLILISDLFDDQEKLRSGLSHFRHEGHEIITFQVLDRDELEFPFDRWTKFENLENPEHEEMVDPSHLKEMYLERLETFQENVKEACHRHQIDRVEMVTDEPYAKALANYLALRERQT